MEHEEDEQKEEDLIMKEKFKKKNLEQNNKNENIITQKEEEMKETDNMSEDYEDDYSVESINIKEELEEKLNSIKTDVQKYYEAKNKKMTWLEFPVEISTTPIPEYLNPDDDIKRELIFYNIAKENAIKGMIELKKLGE